MLRREFDLDLLLSIAKLARSTYYYHAKRLAAPEKYADLVAEIEAIYAKNRGRYGYRRITDELHNRGRIVNHKTVYRLMKKHGIVCCVRAKKYHSYKGEVG
ncbi:MAG: IS3 family transposase, partial [Ruthenibacterium sp.]